MSSIVPPQADTQAEDLEEHEFEIPCGYTAHRGALSAAWAVWFKRPPCGCDRRCAFVYFCGPCWAHRNRYGTVRCNQCDFSFPCMESIQRVERI